MINIEYWTASGVLQSEKGGTTPGEELCWVRDKGARQAAALAQCPEPRSPTCEYF